MKDKRKYLKYCVIFILLFIIGFTLISIKVNKISNMKSYDDSVRIVGVVNSYYYDENIYVIKLKDVVVNDEDKIGSVKLYVAGGVDNNISKGDIVSADVELSLKPLISDNININRLVDEFPYSGYVSSSMIEIVDKEPGLIYFIQENLEVALDNGLSNENSDISYSVLVGDKTEIDRTVSEVFSYAGISHILAVSGLHVGFLAAMVIFILKLCRVGRKTNFIATSVALIFYCALCGFTASVLRATIMTIVLLLSSVIGEEYDGLNSLSLAGIIILLIFPHDLFSLGFQLSFMCVFMIMTLADKMNRCLSKCGVPQVISSAVSISLCVTLGSSIILANSLYEISIISVIANLIIIPLFSITYPILFVIALISMFLPFMSKLLFLPEMLLHGIKLLANLFAEIKFAHFTVFHLGYLLLFVFLIMSFIVKFMMIKRNVKLIMTTTLAVICIILVIVGSLPVKYDSFAMYINYQYNTNSAVITTNSNNKYLIGYDKYSTDKTLTEMKIVELDCWVLQDFEVNEIDEYVDFVKSVKVKNIIIPKNVNYVNKIFNELSTYSNIVIDDCYKDNMECSFIKTKDGIVAGVEIDINNKKILFTNGITKVKLETISKQDKTYDYVVTNKSKYDFLDYGIKADKIVCSNESNFLTNNVILLKNKSLFVLDL